MSRRHALGHELAELAERRRAMKRLALFVAMQRIERAVERHRWWPRLFRTSAFTHEQALLFAQLRRTRDPLEERARLGFRHTYPLDMRGWGGDDEEIDDEEIDDEEIDDEESRTELK